MQCPNCNTQLKREIYEEVPIELCLACGGLWLDQKELQLITQRKIEQIDPSVLSNISHIPRMDEIPEIYKDKERNLKCPLCSSTMELVNYAYNSGIILDRCPNDCGVFLDDNELEAAQAWAEMNDEKKDELDAYYIALAKNAEARANINSSAGSSSFGSFIFGLPSRIANIITWAWKRNKNE